MGSAEHAAALPANSPKNSHPQVTTKEIPKRELRDEPPDKRPQLHVVVLQQKKSQKGNWELNSYGSPVPSSSHSCYNKRNPKKGIESWKVASASSWARRGCYNKRNPKKGIERSEVSACPAAPSRVRYNKRNPKKGIERNPCRNLSVLLSIRYNKRNPKKGIESRKESGDKAVWLPPCYNKRNPKKGIER